MEGMAQEVLRREAMKRDAAAGSAVARLKPDSSFWCGRTDDHNVEHHARQTEAKGCALSASLGGALEESIVLTPQRGFGVLGSSFDMTNGYWRKSYAFLEFEGCCASYRDCRLRPIGSCSRFHACSSSRQPNSHLRM